MPSLAELVRHVWAGLLVTLHVCAACSSEGTVSQPGAIDGAAAADASSGGSSGRAGSGGTSGEAGRDSALMPDATDAAADRGCSGTFECFCGTPICVNGDWQCTSCGG